MTDAASDDDPIAQGFRQPPSQVSLSCFNYMGRIIELRSFISVFFGMLKTADTTKKIVDEIALSEFRYKMSGFNLVKYNYSQHRQLINEIMLSRAVETFDLYLIGILREIFILKPEMLKSEASVDVGTLIDLKSFGDIIAHVAERKLHDLSYKPLSDLRSYISTRTGIDLFRGDEAFNTVLLASEIRNLIAHNDCKSNDLFLRRIKAIDKPSIETRKKDGKIIIDDEWLRRASYTLDSIVFDFDEAAISKFSIERCFKMN